MIELVEIKSNELCKAHNMHRKGFTHTFLKYFDKTSPVFMSFTKFKKCYNSPRIKMFWIVNNDIKVGQIWLKDDNDKIELSRLFVLKTYQNQGIAQKSIMLCEEMYPDCNTWCLDTIKQEKNNCHLYEKIGYISTGEEKIINKRMTIISYVKRKE